MHTDYVLAVIQSLKEGKEPKEVLAGLQAVLKRRGHERLLPRIAAVLDREVSHNTNREVPVITVAKSTDANSSLSKELMSILQVTEKPQVVVDTNTIGGAKLRVKDTEIDATYKTTLINLYHEITK